MPRPLKTLLFLGSVGVTQACSQPAATSDVATTSQNIAGGGNDVDTPAANVVVKLVGPNGSCTGTFITPTAVLTAQHCVTGASDGKPPLGEPIVVLVGATPSSLYTVSSRAQAFPVWPTPQTVGAWGSDLAVLFLDAGQYAIESPNNPDQGGPQPYVVRPSLVDPSPLPNLGMAGWAPGDSPTNRQLAYDNSDEFDGYEGDPDGQRGSGVAPGHHGVLRSLGAM